MRKLTYAVLIILCVSFSSCGSAQENFPDKINVTRSDKLTRLKGTRLFVSMPNGYKPLESMVRVERDNNTYFQVVEVPNSN